MVVLALNSGSSSLKFGLYRISPSRTEELLAETLPTQNTRETVADILTSIKNRLTETNLPMPIAIGHRIVHGGRRLRQHCLIDASVMHQLEAAVAFAPLHMPAALSLIHLAQEQFPGLPQVACFDTSFHADLPDVARVLPIPRKLQQEGIQRYGFHGLSIESILHQLGSDIPNRVIIAHLGNGASVTAVKNGKSVDTSMGLTPSGGVIMGTRSGDIDPGILLYLLREKKIDAAMLADLIDQRSGMLGISGISSDMRYLHKAALENADARLAIQMFCYSVSKQIAAMSVALDGIDLLVFTGGIGENDAQVRSEICKGLSWAGINLDEDLNQSSEKAICNTTSRCEVQVIPSQEGAQIARYTCALSTTPTKDIRLKFIPP